MYSRQNNNLYWIFTCLGLILCGSMVYVTSYWDVPISQALAEYGQIYPRLVDFANRSVFQSDAVGLSDFPIFFIIGTFLFLLLAPFLSRFFFITPRQLVCGNFILLSAAALSVAIHLLKGAISRPRPHSIDLMSYSGHSQQFLWPINWTFDAWGKGSFPSGHTASMVGMLVVIFTLKSKRAKLAAGILIFPTIIWMAFSRIAVQAHWASDTLASFLIGLVTIGLVKKYIFQLDDQLKLCEKASVQTPRSGFAWEWKLFPSLVLLMLSPLLPAFLYSIDLPSVLIFFTLLLAVFIFWKLPQGIASESKKHLNMLRSHIR